MQLINQTYVLPENSKNYSSYVLLRVVTGCYGLLEMEELRTFIIVIHVVVGDAEQRVHAGRVKKTLWCHQRRGAKVSASVLVNEVGRKQV